MTALPEGWFDGWRVVDYARALGIDVTQVVPAEVEYVMHRPGVHRVHAADPVGTMRPNVCAACGEVFDILRRLAPS